MSSIDTLLSCNLNSRFGNMSKPIITFITGNRNKLNEISVILGSDVPFVLRSQELDLPELQGDPTDVAIAKCKQAAQRINGPVFVEDTSLCFNALGGLPGPYIKWFLEKIGHTGLNNLLQAYEDKSAYAQTIVAYADGSDDLEPKLFIGRTEGIIVPARGSNNFGWDSIFQPHGYSQTYAEMDKEMKNTLSHRYKSIQKLRAHFLET
ncbi:hypothetical protein ABG067_007632 [Albugo candida]|uniref:Inosine triphosphate pyrophosphatase n=1 Tax=Albugo candida TaxID=65357 RepID=A0A024G630_9STRA|nr:unnamed protein product [Albugo candida]|eukprot:CCI42123.1 unnamed protein product [Albugo candida]